MTGSDTPYQRVLDVISRYVRDSDTTTIDVARLMALISNRDITPEQARRALQRGLIDGFLERRGEEYRLTAAGENYLNNG